MVWEVLKRAISHSSNRVPKRYQLRTFSLYFIAIEMERERRLELYLKRLRGWVLVR